MTNTEENSIFGGRWQQHTMDLIVKQLIYQIVMEKGSRIGRNSMPMSSDDENMNINLANMRSKYCLQKNRRCEQSSLHSSFGRRMHRKPSVLHQTQGEMIKQSQKRLNPSEGLIQRVKRYRIQKAVFTFLEKLKQTSILQKPNNLTEISEKSELLQRIFQDREGHEANSFWVAIIQIICFCIYAWLSVVYSLVLVFDHVQTIPIFRFTQAIALLNLFIEIYLGCFIKTYDNGKLLNHIRQIVRYYFKGKVKTDAAFLLIFVVDLCWYSGDPMGALRMCVLFRFFSYFSRTKKIENVICTNLRRKQQWDLLQILFFNLMFVHILSIVLNSMAFINTEINWLIKNNLHQQAWYVRYVYGYYWGITIMLTVGFGDFTASNWQEALCLTFIQLVSCVLFSYNINCVGSLIKQLQLEQKQKQKNLRTFRKICVDAQVSTIKGIKQLQSKINHFIEKSSQIQSQFDLKVQKETLDLLPKRLSQEFLKKINRRLFDELTLFGSLTSKTIQRLALHIHKKIGLPEEIIVKKGEISRLWLLNKGQIAYIISSSLKHSPQPKIIHRIDATQGKSTLLSFNSFIKKAAQKYDIMCVDYGVLYTFDSDQFQKILKHQQIDYQKYCQLRDASKYIPEDIQCTLCNSMISKHTRFDCPKEHYIPLKQLVCMKYNKLKSTNKRKRFRVSRQRQGNYLNNISSQYYANKNKASGLQVSLKCIILDESQFMPSVHLEQIPYECDRLHLWKYYFLSQNFTNVIQNRILKD